MKTSSLTRWFLQMAFRLPVPLLRLLSGGGVIYQEGHTLDPHFQFWTSQFQNNRPPSNTTVPDVRLETRRLFALVAGKPVKTVAIESRRLKQGPFDVPVRLYRPRPDRVNSSDVSAPTLVYFHRGGGVVGDLDTAHVFCTILAEVLNCSLVSVHYRLAPEHRYPAGFEDCLFAYRYVRDNAPMFGISKAVPAVCGESMGGCFAAAIAQELKVSREPQPSYSLLISPHLDMMSEVYNLSAYRDGPIVTKDLLDWFFLQYLGPESDPKDPRLSPLQAKDLSGLAKTFIVTTGFDMLRPQGQDYAASLKRFGVPTDLWCYENLPHGFTSFCGIDSARAACYDIGFRVKQALKSSFKL